MLLIAEARLTLRGDFRTKSRQLFLVEVRDERITEISAAPEHYVEAALGLERGLHGAERAGSRRPGQPVSAKQEQRNGVKTPLDRKRPRLAIQKKRNRPTLERKLVVTAETEGGREIDATGKPRF